MRQKPQRDNKWYNLSVTQHILTQGDIVRLRIIIFSQYLFLNLRFDDK